MQRKSDCIKTSKSYLEQSQSIKLSESQKSEPNEGIDIKIVYFHEVKNFFNLTNLGRSKEEILFSERTWLVDKEEKQILSRSSLDTVVFLDKSIWRVNRKMFKTVWKYAVHHEGKWEYR